MKGGNGEERGGLGKLRGAPVGKMTLPLHGHPGTIPPRLVGPVAWALIPTAVCHRAPAAIGHRASRWSPG